MKQTLPIYGLILIFLLFLQPLQAENNPDQAFNVSVPMAGNAWVIKDGAFAKSEIVGKNGIRNWNDPDHRVRAYFYIGDVGILSLGIRAKATSGSSRITATCIDRSFTVEVNNTEFNDIPIGEIKIDKPGYYYVDLTGMSKSGPVFADISDLLLKVNDPAKVTFIKDEFYWGRRGPSVHLWYTIPEELQNVEWFYTELLIPENEDVIGSYFMAVGFNGGYFGIQVNSETERRVLFSIWSPYKTDDPSEIPEEYKVKVLKKGEGVYTGKFGNEGSGGQSYKVYDWKAGVTYGFFVGARPVGDGSTDYIAYFRDPNRETLQLIAQFRRPKTDSYLKGIYSFLENFRPEQGIYDRKGYYTNQWAYANGAWHEINQAKFTADATARKKHRLDYTGGVDNDKFYLKNCGFINEHTEIGTIFTRAKTGKFPKFKLPGQD
jgi:hypothetical protein